TVEESKAVAMKTAKEKIEEAFRNENIQELINRTAQDIVRNKIKFMIDTLLMNSQLSFDTIFNFYPDLMEANRKMEVGEKSGVLSLDSIRRNSNNITLKRVADRFL